MSIELVEAGRVAFRDVTLRVGNGAQAREAVRDVTLSVPAGQLVCVLGPSGCGKSTLLGGVAGFIEVARGEIAVAGRTVASPGPDRGMVFQQQTLLPWRSVLDNVAFALKVRGVSEALRHARARSLLDVVGLLPFERYYPAQLSGGMQQRVELARALINEPRVLLMDEPFGALDAQTRIDMQEFLLAVWARTRPTVLFVTHDVDEAVFLADRVLVMTGQPGTVCADIDVPLPRPRRAELLASPAFVQLRKRCLELVRDGVHTTDHASQPEPVRYAEAPPALGARP